MLNRYSGHKHRSNTKKHPGKFFISKTLAGPLTVWNSLDDYLKSGFKPYRTDFEVLPPDTPVCVYVDLDITSTESVEIEVFYILENIKSKLDTSIRWVGTSHKKDKQSYHVLFNKTMTVRQQGHFFKTLGSKWIDLKVYNENQLFRAYKQNKPGQHRPIVDHPRPILHQHRLEVYILDTIHIYIYITKIA